VVAWVPRVSAIIPTYNRSAVLRYAIASALQQTFTDFELLVVGDGCTDDSAEVVASFGDARVQWINLPENTRHQSGPNNEGLRQARGEIVAYLGHDDLWLPQHLSSLVTALDATGADVAYALSINVAPDGTIWPTMPRPDHGTFASPLCVAHRLRATQESGGWRNYRDLKIGPDVELWQRLHAAGHRFTFVPRLGGVKFPGSWRRDVYKSRPSHEQAEWFARMRSDPDFEAHQLASLLVNKDLLRGLPYGALLQMLVREVCVRVRIRLSLPWLGFAYTHGGVDAIRRFKGL
jgi:glycosyltransferase involved in cell wall biosynthesis